METKHRFHPIILAHAREMRHPQPPAEATLWQHLRNRNLEFKFSRQHPIERFIIEFYCAEVKLCAEIDGDSHLKQEQQEYDVSRTDFLKSLGYNMIRFTNNDVRYNINAVTQEILDTCREWKSKKNNSNYLSS